jgi:hypothetical protein
MINNQRRKNQTIQGCVGVNLRVCPAIANSIGTSKQTEFLDSQLTEKVQVANLRQKKEIILRFSAYSAGKENNLSQKYAEKDKQGINILVNKF